MIVRWADMGRGTVRRELERMTAAGLLIVTREGNQLHYQANEACPVYSELLGIVRKTFGIVDVLRRALQPLDSEIELAFIFGSIAKATDTKNSDIDLMLVAKHLTYSNLVNLLIPVEEKLQRPINPTIYTPGEFRTRTRRESDFLERVVSQPKLMIKGRIDDFRESGEETSIKGGTGQ